MPVLFGTYHKPLVLQFAKQDSPAGGMVDLLYLRVLCEISTFLRQDTATILEDDGPLQPISDADAMDAPDWERICHRYVKLEHAKLPSACVFNPESDVLWFSHETDNHDLNEMTPYYGAQLGTIRKVIFEETEWDDAQKCLTQLVYFPGVQTVYVWLDSYRFQSGALITDQEGYCKRARDLIQRDRALLRDHDVLVEYIDCNGEVYGGFRVRTDV